MRIFNVLSVAVVVMSLGACTEMQVASHFYKKSAVANAPYEAPAITQKRKVGNPYKVLGKTYYPIANSEGFRQKGVASWYGKDFHGKKTANGERYNMYAMTAAHPVLPLPTYVRVTNLENGRSVVVKVNDRGPFLRGRVIDMSFRAAQELGMDVQGTAPVLVEALPTDGSRLASAPQKEDVFFDNHLMTAEKPEYKGFTHHVSQHNVVEMPKVVAQDAPAPQRSHFTREDVPLAKSKVFVQVGAFTDINNAQHQLSMVKVLDSNAKIMLAEQGNQTFYRVRVGPFTTVAQADAVLNKVIENGHASAILAVE